jgi:Fe-S-cluster containining protein
MQSNRRRVDQKLVQIVDAALADATRRSGKWLVCKPGCSQCCVGVFAISQLDAVRLRDGLAKLEVADPKRAARLKKRIAAARRTLSNSFPGDVSTGVLDESEEAQERFEEFANDVPCPVLDPQTGTCDLYESRPLTCRAFGPPVRSEGGLGVCELCFQGATVEEIAAAEMQVDPDGLEAKLLAALEKRTGARGSTIVAMAFEK